MATGGGRSERLAIVGVFLLALLICVSLGWSCYRSVQAATEAASRVTHSYRVIGELSNLLSTIKDAETGERGFIITGDQRYLAPYRAALGTVKGVLENLPDLAKDNPHQLQRLGSIETLTRDRLEQLAETINLRSRKGFPSARAVLMRGVGKDTMNAIRGEVGLAIGEEEELLRVRTAVQKEASNRATYALLVGDLVGIFVLLALFAYLWREMSARIKSAEELRQSEQILLHQSRMAAMGEMLNNIAHQWRQPLNVLGLTIQELEFCYKDGSFTGEFLEDSVAEAMKTIKHMSQTIDVFRDFMTLNREKLAFGVNQVIAKTVGLINEDFKNKNIDIDFVSSGDPQANGYPNEYGQVLLNLLMNAKDAFLERSVSNARILVHSWAENGKAVVTITDNAGGIDQENLDKVFDAYFTTKALGRGTGIGLFMSKNIIENSMGGRLSVRNVAGGAEFRFEV
jgi:signal transduction histidine kinase